MILKYGSIVAVIGFLSYSVISSYTLREEIGGLEKELKFERQRSEQVIEEVNETNNRLNQLMKEKKLIYKEIDKLRRSTNEEYFNYLYDMLYDRMPDNTDSGADTDETTSGES